jgi:geranylgeranyl transferase type-2 subunit alpha
LKRLLEADKRNFMGWAYRRFVAECAGVSAADEEQYFMDCINANFSNYSAWHARTVLLPRMHAAQPTISLADLLKRDLPSAADPPDTSSSSSEPHACAQTALALMSSSCTTLAVREQASIARVMLEQLRGLL